MLYNREDIDKKMFTCYSALFDQFILQALSASIGSHILTTEHIRFQFASVSILFGHQITPL